MSVKEYVMPVGAVLPAVITNPLQTLGALIVLWLALSVLSTFYSTVVYRKFLSPFKNLPSPALDDPFFGHVRTLIKCPYGPPLLKWRREIIPHESGFYRIFFGKSEALVPTSTKAISAVVNRPADFVVERQMFEAAVPQGLVSADGDYHTFLRKIFSPMLGKQANLLQLPDMWAVAQITRRRLISSRKQVINLDNFIQYNNLEVMIRTLFGDSQPNTAPGGAEHHIDLAVKQFMNMVVRDGVKGTALWLLTPNLIPFETFVKLPLQDCREWNQAVQTLRDYTIQKIRHRMARAQTEDDKYAGNDILSRLLRVGVTDEAQLIDHLVTFLLAGHSVSSPPCIWLMYEIARNPAKQARLRAELQEFLPKMSPENPPTAAELMNLPYLHACVMEGVRLFPSFPFTTQRATRDTDLMGMFVPKDTAVVISPYAINRDTEFWGPDAEEFRPERWIDSRTGGASSAYAFMSFLQGPRTCIGKDYSLHNIHAMVASLVRDLVFEEEVPGRPLAVSHGTRLATVGGVRVRVRRAEASKEK